MNEPRGKEPQHADTGREVRVRGGVPFYLRYGGGGEGVLPLLVRGRRVLL